jgi:choline-sulfatase
MRLFAACLSFWIALITAATSRAEPAGQPSAPRRPNVLLICADDHAVHAVGAYGNRLARTPRIDRLAAGGLRFDRAYCNSPVCTASRQSFLTGRYPRTIGVTELKTPLPESEITLADLLSAAGYATAAIGKMHFNSNLTHGFELRLDAPDHARLLAARGRSPLPDVLPVQPVWRPFRDPAAVWLNSDCLPVGAVAADMPSTWYADEAARFLEQSHDAPFLLVVSFTEPHSPFHFPVEYRGRRSAEEFPAIVPGPEDDDQIPAIFRDLTAEQKQGIAAAYHTSVEFLDGNVGRVLDALDRSGLADDTLVIYLGDHGYLLGQHGRIEKHCSFEEAIHAPLLMRLPGVIPEGGATPALVEFVDIVPTVLELCGVDCPSTVQGRSLLPLARGERDAHRDYVVVEYAPNDEAVIRDGRWKLVYQRGQRRREDGYDPGTPLPGPTFRLFDQRDDPRELTDLADRPEHAETVARLRDQLVAHLKATARQPELIPATDDPMALLDHLVQPRDVGGPAGRVP